MKKTLLVVLSLLITVVNYAQGIEFEHGTWAEILEKAKQTNKPIFVDVFTTWCGPCKRMSSEVFPLAKVGNEYNKSFICYKVDAEKGEGVSIARKYDVNAYPTYLFIKADKSLIMKSVGSMEADKFISLTESVKEEMGTARPISTWDREYAQKKKDTAFILGYIHKRAKLGMQNAALFDEYLALLPNDQRASKEVAELYRNEGRNIKLTSLAYKNLETNSLTLYGKLGFYINSIMTSAIDNSFRESIKMENEVLLQQVIDANENLPKTEASKQKEEFYIKYYKDNKVIDQYIKHANLYCENSLMPVSLDSIEKLDKASAKVFEQTKSMYTAVFKDSEQIAEMKEYMTHLYRNKYSQALNEIAWGFFENVLDHKELENALTWSKRSIDIHPSEELVDTYANLLYKLGRKEEAIIKEKEALEIARSNKSDTKTYEDVIKKMKSGEKTWK